MSGTEEDGSFAKDGLEPGIYGLAARTDDGRFGILPGVSVTAESEVTNLLISVSPGGKVRLQYEGSKPQVFVMVITKGVPVGWATSVEAGKPFLVSAPAGSVTLGVSDAFKEKPREQQIEIVVGETKDFVLRD